MRGSLTRRITVLVFGLLVLFTAALGTAAFLVTRDWLRTTAVANLEALASSRQLAINEQLRDITDHHEALARFHLPYRVARLVSATGDARASASDELESRLRREHAAKQSLRWVAVLTPDGRDVLAIAGDTAKLVRDDAFHQALAGLAGRQLVRVPVTPGQMRIQVLGPIRDTTGATIATLAFEVWPKTLLDTLGDYTGLGRSGETVLGVRDGQVVRFPAPVRFAPAARIEPAKIRGERARPIIHATAGQAGVTEALDYRKARVVAAFRPLTLPGWGVVVKQDAVDAFASIGQLGGFMLLVVAAVLLLAVIVSVPLARRLTQPLRELEGATKRVAAGDLTVVVAEGRDEVGVLAASFNRMVQRLSTALGELERSNADLDAFAYAVSHDLKAPLRAIRNLAGWLEEDLGDRVEADQREQLELLRARVARMQALIDGLLEYSRLGRGVSQPAEPIPLADVVASAIDAVSPPTGIAVKVAGELPTVVADQQHLVRVMQNLIGNAVVHHPGPEGCVTVSCEDRGAAWRIAVADDGDGVPPEHHERIFAMFQSLRGEREGSTGLGLALVKKIVEEAGGRIQIESTGQPGLGAVFSFSWPKREPSVPKSGGPG